MRSDDRQEPSLVLVDDLEKVNDPELGDAPREAGQIGEHHRPVLTEEVPDALVDALGGGALLRELLDESPQPDLASLQVMVGAVGHLPAPPHRSRLAKEGSCDLVVGNPPYRGLSQTESFGYVATTYPRDKADLYAAFLERALDLTKSGGASALLTVADPGQPRRSSTGMASFTTRSSRPTRNQLVVEIYESEIARP